ncbi:hypothetical protein HYV85_05920 [Candidatus Woesearchaeota archaeon]|nr:hypothetical protein [Candidatus Woesearchaeota archaeon]
MFSSPLAHYFRHALLAYHESGGNLRHRLLARRELNSLEASCLKLQMEHPRHPKIPVLIERIRSMKASL